MHRLIFGHPLAELVALILLLGLTFYFLNKEKANVHGNAENSDTSASSSLTVPTETNSGASSLSTESSGNRYNVFLSFSGKDTRNSFTDHLYHKLFEAGVSTFRDNNELRQGKKIGSDLFAAIENSEISIPILSVNYGTSSWCLNELVRIMECKNKKGHIVLPIFYKVEPSDVGHQIGSFGEEFRKRETRLLRRGIDPMILQKWKQTLGDVSSLKGWNVLGLEGELVKSVVQKVCSLLIEKFELDTPKNLIGIDSHVEKVMKFIANNSHAPLFVGIHGMGGVGKTTIAKTIYNKLLKEFEYRSFIDNIRENYKHGVENLQKQLISDILRMGENKVPTKDAGIKILSSYLKNKKVLILLDDVDADDHLNDLARSHSWFSPGSVIIITTRDESILDRANVNHKHEHKGLDEGNSLILFSRHAFRKDTPLSGFEKLADEVVSTTGGLPLSLKVVGSLLYTKERGVWEDTIRQLKRVPNKDVQGILQISYNALEDEEKHIFLDIACFFIGTDWRIAFYMWNACNFYPKKGIDVLRSKSLIKVGENHKLIMHDQLRDLGREIVRKKDVKEPRNRSRLWDSEEILTMLEEDEGSSEIEALCLPMGETYTAEKFKNLTNLRFLRTNGASIIGDFQNLLPQLRWLEWTSCCLYLEAAIFRPKKLVVLDLSYSKIMEDWGGWDLLKMATELKVLDLAYCTLRTTPDLSAFKSLEILSLKNCEALEEIHPSVEGIKTLVSLNVGWCGKLNELPQGVGRMKELRELRINETNIQKIPISRGCLTNLEILHASGCELLAQLPKSLGSLVSLTELDLSCIGIEELPKSIGSLKELRTLDASYCTSLASVPSSIGNLASLSLLDLTGCDKLVQLPDSIGSLALLQCLLFSGCSSLGEIPNSIGQLESLTELHLKFTAIEELPKSIGSLKELRTLSASYCASLASVPSFIGDLASLSLLDLTGCKKLAQLPDSIGSLTSLECLLLSGCKSLGEIPYSIGQLESLTELHLKSTAIEELPKSIGSLKELRTLDASYCTLASVPSSIGNLASLSLLDLTGCDELAQLPDSIGSLTSLQCLLLSRCSSLREIPDSIGQLESLIELYLQSTAIEELPKSIGSLKKLTTLHAPCCASLASVPSSIGDLASLSLLNLIECDKLAQLPDSIGSLTSLQHLVLSGCSSLGEIPNSIGQLESLIELHLKSTAIEQLPKSIGSLKKLRILDASYCASLASVPSSIRNLASLSLLDLTGCNKLA